MSWRQPKDRRGPTEHLFYTHGYGLVAVPVNAVTTEGQPDYLVSGINQQGQLAVGEPRIYFGEAESSYVVTGTKTAEFDYPVGEDQNATTTWKGSTGVGVGGFFNRLLFAIRFGDLNLLISNQLTDTSQILFRRTLQERVQAIAPFLTYDRDPYLVSADGRLLWIWDAYTTSDHYPNSQPLDGDLFTGMNYVRNSVKVVIDAYDGSVRFYIADPNDPIINAWARIFPQLFQPLSAMSPDLQAHLRYPEDLFTAENMQYLLYHVPGNAAGAETLYSKQDRWALASQQTDVSGESTVVEPYYVIMKLPGESNAEFVLIQPLGDGRSKQHDRVGRRPDGPGALRRAHRIPLPDEYEHLRPRPDPGAHQPGQHGLGAVHALVAGRLERRAGQPPGAADGRLDPLRGADLPALDLDQPAGVQARDPRLADGDCVRRHDRSGAGADPWRDERAPAGGRWRRWGWRWRWRTAFDRPGPCRAGAGSLSAGPGSAQGR